MAEFLPALCVFTGMQMRSRATLRYFSLSPGSNLSAKCLRFRSQIEISGHKWPNCFSTGIWSVSSVVRRILRVWIACLSHDLTFLFSLCRQITTIIIQTHVSPPFRTGHTCISRPICAMAETDLLPSFVSASIGYSGNLIDRAISLSTAAKKAFYNIVTYI